MCQRFKGFKPVITPSYYVMYDEAVYKVALFTHLDTLYTGCSRRVYTSLITRCNQ